MREPLSVAVIGCGWAGVRHAQAFMQAGARVTWAVDSDLEKAGQLGRLLKADVHASQDYQAALADPQVDAVDVCLPHNLHALVSIAAALAGKHILCEKPIAANLAEADRMIAASRQAGKLLMIAENEHFLPLTHKIRELVQAGVIGQPALLQMTRQCYLTESFMQERKWFLSAESAAGGAMMVGGVHDFETARLVVGDIESIYALRAPQRFPELEGDDTSLALVRFRGGAVGSFVLTFVMKSLVTAAGPEIHTLRLDGALGSLTVEDGHTLRVFSEKEGWCIGEKLIQHEIYVPEQDTFLLEVQHFLECLRTGAEPVTNGASQRRPLEIVLAAYQSMQIGQPVSV